MIFAGKRIVRYPQGDFTNTAWPAVMGRTSSTWVTRLWPLDYPYWCVPLGFVRWYLRVSRNKWCRRRPSIHGRLYSVRHWYDADVPGLANYGYALLERACNERPRHSLDFHQTKIARIISQSDSRWRMRQHYRQSNEQPGEDEDTQQNGQETAQEQGPPIAGKQPGRATGRSSEWHRRHDRLLRHSVSSLRLMAVPGFWSEEYGFQLWSGLRKIESAEEFGIKEVANLAKFAIQDFGKRISENNV